MVAAGTKIKDYTIIGDGRSAALVSNRGSIDWLCWPRFDSSSIFAALLDPEAGGCWSIHPLGTTQATRHYLDETNVLETELSTETGKMVLTDFMPVTSEKNKKAQLWPEHELVRQVRGTDGEVRVILDFSPCLDYGRLGPQIKNAGPLGWRIEVGPGLFTLRGDIELLRSGGGLSATFTLRAGDVVSFSLSYSAEGPAIIPLLGD